MRILHLASWYPNQAHGQLGNFVQRHIESIPKGLENRVLHVWTGPKRLSGNSVVNAGRKEGERCRVDIRYVLNFPPRRIRIERCYIRLYKKLKQGGYRPDIVHLHNAAEAARPACRMAGEWGVPLVVSENWTAYHAEDGRAFRPKEESAVCMALGQAEVHLPVSEHLGRAMARFAPDVRQVVVPNVVDSIFVPPQDPRAMEGPLRLLHVSSLMDDHKDITGMLMALGDAVVRGADVVLDCWGGAGAGLKEVPRYQGLVGSLGLSGRVRFLGPASPAQVVEAMGKADAFVLFSRYENLPCVLLESWMTGLPTLATDVGGVGEHLGRHSGLGTLLKAGDREGLTEAILKAATDKAQGARPDAGAIHAYASTRFTPDAVGNAIEEVYRSVAD